MKQFCGVNKRLMNKGGKFLKKLALHQWESIAGNLVLTTELKT